MIVFASYRETPLSTKCYPWYIRIDRHLGSANTLVIEYFRIQGVRIQGMEFGQIFRISLNFREIEFDSIRKIYLEMYKFIVKL